MNNLQAQQKLMAGGKSRASSPPPTPRGAPNLSLPTSPHHHSLNNSLNSTLQNNNIKEFFSRHSFAKNKVINNHYMSSNNFNFKLIANFIFDTHLSFKNPIENLKNQLHCKFNLRTFTYLFVWLPQK